MLPRHIALLTLVPLLVTACPSGGQRRGDEVDNRLLAEVNLICQTDRSGGETWDLRIKQTLLAYVDDNASGDIDAMAELAKVPCAVWRRMDEGVRQDQPAGFMQVYGFDPRLIWVGTAVGVSELLRDQATEYLSGCGLTTDMRDAPRPAGGEQDMLGEVDAVCRSDKAGTDAWDVRIKQILVARADINGTGDIDSVDELELVPCDVWRRMDLGMQRDYGSAFMTIYGFDPKLIWVGSAVGVNEALRRQATQYLINCGMSAGMD